MTVIYLTENNTGCFGVIFQKKGCAKVQKNADVSDNERNAVCANPLRTLLLKIKYVI